MIVKARGIQTSISISYHWLNEGYLDVTKVDRFYTRHCQAAKKTANSNVKPAGKSIEEWPKVINPQLEKAYSEMDTVILIQTRYRCLLVLTDRRFPTNPL